MSAPKPELTAELRAVIDDVPVVIVNGQDVISRSCVERVVREVVEIVVRKDAAVAYETGLYTDDPAVIRRLSVRNLGAEMKLTKAQLAVLAEVAKPCEIANWKYGPLSHPWWNTATYRSLINRHLIRRDDCITRTKEGWTFTAHLCAITDAGRAALERE